METENLRNTSWLKKDMAFKTSEKLFRETVAKVIKTRIIASIRNEQTLENEEETIQWK